MKIITKLINNTIKFVKSITNPGDDWQPHPDYPWLEINGNLSWRVNTKHPDWWNGVMEKWDNVDTSNTDIPYVHSKCLVCGKVHPNGLPCPEMKIT